ncbi:cobalt/nickel transport protein [Natronoarchaeum philippinense]|uniref:Cobalt/nickel transport protein n=1 Tax=Natronoarchaeum philippinense TaxID=558529 RepID=A0A285N4L5_NATPI|nr:PDGLE domain-containing protein [Natronoarchaeum philippinense]SNZ02926.1 cobalt/nickel transport protein [Natronoarchaeum philippinense]
MSVRSLARGRWQQRSLAGLTVMVLFSPVFAWAATRVGYSEPMENAAEAAGAASHAVATDVSLFSGYALPGLGPHLGTLGGALFGTVLTLVLGVGVARALAPSN